MEVAMPSRRRQKAVRSTDPGQSAWWLLPSAGGIIAGGIGAVASQTLTHNAVGSAMVGAVSGTVAGLGAATPQFRDWVSARSRTQQIAESAGFPTNINSEPLESLRVHSSDRDITEFVPRDIQHQLVEHLNNGMPVLIEGPSMSGKTRLALETIRAHWPEAPLWYPRDDDDIERLLSSNQQPAPKTVIFLDDIDRFLSNQTLTLGLVNRWANNSCTIIATIMQSQYLKHSDRSNEKATGWEVLNRFNRLTLPPSLSTKELDDVKLTSYAKELPQIKTIGLGPLLGCAEDVRAAFTKELSENSWCGALLRGAADWRRIGLGLATKQQLEILADSYKTDTWNKDERNEAWRRATQKIRNTVALLHQTENNKWEILDLIVDEATWPLANSTFSALVNTELSASQSHQAAWTMRRHGAPPSLTGTMFERAVTEDPTNTTFLVSYALFLSSYNDRMDEAQELFRSATNTDQDKPFSCGNYATFLQTVRGDMDQAEQKYQEAIAADPTNATNLGNYATFLQTVRGDMDQAEQKYQEAIAADPTNALSIGGYTAIRLTDQSKIVQTQLVHYRIETESLALHTLSSSKPFKTKGRKQGGSSKHTTSNADPTLTNFMTFPTDDRCSFTQILPNSAYATNRHPNNGVILENYATFLETIRNNTQLAETMFQRALSIDPSNSRTLNNYAVFLQNNDCLNQAQHMFQQGLTADPTNTTLLNNYAVFLVTKLGNTIQAQHMFEQAVTLEPNNPFILKEYATFLATFCQDMDRALEFLRRAIEA
jgi:hypothetical protein